MCGRYFRRSDKQRIAEAFHTRNDISSLAMPPADYNIAPSTFQPVIRDKEGHWLQSFSIVTTEANELLSAVHTRMPVILHSRDYDRWLSREADRMKFWLEVARVPDS